MGTISAQAVYDVLGALTRAGLPRRIEPAGSPFLSSPDARSFVIDEAEVTFWGLCPACQTTLKSPPKERAL